MDVPDSNPALNSVTVMTHSPPGNSVDVVTTSTSAASAPAGFMPLLSAASTDLRSSSRRPEPGTVCEDDDDDDLDLPPGFDDDFLNPYQESTSPILPSSVIMNGRTTTVKPRASDGTLGRVKRFAASTIGTFDLADRKQLAEFAKIRPKKRSEVNAKTVPCPHKVRFKFC